MSNKKNIIIFPKIYFFKIIHLIYILLLSTTPIKNECPKEAPISIDNNCLLKYCTEQQYKENKCIIDNKIIKTQWLNNIIQIGDLNFRYINFATFSNGDMVVETTSYPCGETRMFYGIKNNGRGFFNDNSKAKKINFYSIKAKEQPLNVGKCKFESEIFIAKINEGINKGKEYLVSFSKGNQYTELYLFDENKINQIQTSSLFGTQISSYRSATFSYIVDNKIYILASYTITSDNKNYIYFKKMSFSSNAFNNKNPSILSFQKTNNLGNSVSCFVTEQKYIICIYLCQESNGKIGPLAKNVDSICLISLDQNLKEIKTISYRNNIYTDSNSFLKCIHLKGEVGAFIYYYYNKVSKLTNTYEVIYPIVLLKKYNSNRFENYITSIDSIPLNKYAPFDSLLNILLIKNNLYFDNYCLKNDLIKINEDKICFTTSSSNNETLYIVILNIIESQNVVIRYYSIDIYKLNNYKFLLDMRSHLYNNFISLAFSYCPQDDCSNDKSDDHYSAFLIFSYPNGTDSRLNINKYLFDNNNIKINNITIDLKKYSKIDNNIFGYVYYGFNIKENSCNNTDLLSYDSNEIIDIDKPLKHQKIKLKFKNKLYDKIRCVIKYGNIYTDPSFSDYEKYVDKKDNDFDESSYNNQIEQYEGKTNFYIIFIENSLQENCEKNCELCLIKNKSICITCKYNYTIIKENDKKKKICLENTLINNDIIIEEKKETEVIVEKNLEVNEKEREEEAGKKEEEKEKKEEGKKEEEKEKKEEEKKEENEKKEEEKKEEEKEKKEEGKKEEEKEEKEEVKEETKKENEKEVKEENKEESEKENGKEMEEDKNIESTQIYQKEIIKEEKNDKSCSNEEILENKCGAGILKNEQIGKLPYSN